MNTRLGLIALMLLGLQAAPLAATGEPVVEDDRHVFTGALDLSAIDVSSPFTTWLDHGEGKLRYDEDDNTLQFTRAFLEYRGRLTSTVVAHGVLNIQDTKEKTVDLTEAFLEWRPVPTTPWRFRTRLGAFYPKLSLENVDAGWSNAYALSASAINTWIGEELRTFGSEVRVSRVFTELPLTPEIAFEGAIFYGNDPTGALLNSRGWAIHDRQTGITSALPLPDVSAIEPWIPMPSDSASFKPFEEIDHKPGFYGGAEWRMGESFRLKLFRYDNRGDPEAQEGSSYAWRTRFDHLGLQFMLPGEIGVIGQWLDGHTKMGPDLGPWHVWDSDFDAQFLLLTRAFGKHRLTARYDAFDVRPYNDPEGFTNRDQGHSWTAGYLFSWSERIRLGVEYLTIDTEHCDTNQCAWVFSGLPRTTQQNQLQLSLRWQFQKGF